MTASSIFNDEKLSTCINLSMCVPALLKVMAVMIRQSRLSPAVLEVKKRFLSDLTILCTNNKENRRYDTVLLVQS